MHCSVRSSKWQGRTSVMCEMHMLYACSPDATYTTWPDSSSRSSVPKNLTFCPRNRENHVYAHVRHQPKQMLYLDAGARYIKHLPL